MTDTRDANYSHPHAAYKYVNLVALKDTSKINMFSPYTISAGGVCGRRKL
jgi:hypothetical protein